MAGGLSPNLEADFWTCPGVFSVTNSQDFGGWKLNQKPGTLEPSEPETLDLKHGTRDLATWACEVDCWRGARGLRLGTEGFEEAKADQN